ncbi:MAG: hypothetical protein KBF59_06320 [Ignavibacterium sp.]|jgi:hypothetical protein|nr:hypothetical protein [Ignavibacterium sp.]
MATIKENYTNIITDSEVTQNSSLFENDKEILGFEKETTNNNKPDRKVKGLWVKFLDNSIRKNIELQYYNKQLLNKKGEVTSTENKFANDTLTALNYIQTNDADKNLLSGTNTVKDIYTNTKSKIFIINVSENEKGSSYQNKNKTLIFDSINGKRMTNERNEIIYQSPALELGHELGHTFRDIFNNVKPMTEANFNLAKFIEEEQLVVEKFEWPMAVKLKEGVRKNYITNDLKPYIKMESVISNEPLEE